MIVKTGKKGIYRNLDVTEIIIVPDPDPDKLNMWHCPTCRNYLFQYKGRAVSVSPNASNLPLPVVVRCWKCKKKYSVVRIV